MWRMAWTRNQHQNRRHHHPHYDPPLPPPPPLSHPPLPPEAPRARIPRQLRGLRAPSAQTHSKLRGLRVPRAKIPRPSSRSSPGASPRPSWEHVPCQGLCLGAPKQAPFFGCKKRACFWISPRAHFLRAGTQGEHFRVKCVPHPVIYRSRFQKQAFR